MGPQAVGRGCWLGTADCTGIDPLRGAELRRADVRAGRAALGVARRAADLTEEPAYSVSHTGGRGVAIVGPSDYSLGIDLVSLGRVRTRHARAILSTHEWRTLERFDAALRPALAWALKEAAAKATGSPARWFPDRLLITESESGRLAVSVVGNPEVTFEANWCVDGPDLCAWVVGRLPLPPYSHYPL